jgi:ABC-type dipeptide/oligopeptide/nickel transport system ATPase component
MILVTHDIAVVAENCDTVAVMYAGQIVERGPTAVLVGPLHPYTIGLQNAFPRMPRRSRQRRPLISIPGGLPNLLTRRRAAGSPRAAPSRPNAATAEDPILPPDDGSAMWRRAIIPIGRPSSGGGGQAGDLERTGRAGVKARKETPSSSRRVT